MSARVTAACVCVFLAVPLAGWEMGFWEGDSRFTKKISGVSAFLLCLTLGRPAFFWLAFALFSVGFASLFPLPAFYFLCFQHFVVCFVLNSAWQALLFRTHTRRRSHWRNSIAYCLLVFCFLREKKEFHGAKTNSSFSGGRYPEAHTTHTLFSEYRTMIVRVQSCLDTLLQFGTSEFSNSSAHHTTAVPTANAITAPQQRTVVVVIR